MNQTSWIAGSIFVGFIVYVTMKGELSQYKDAIFGPGSAVGADGLTNPQRTEQTGYQGGDPSMPGYKAPAPPAPAR